MNKKLICFSFALAAICILPELGFAAEGELSIDAVLPHSDKGDYYFFSGDYYVRYSGGIGIKEKYPRKVSDEWHGMADPDVFPPPYDAAFQKSSDADKYYFFKGSQYVRYQRDVGVDDKYPLEITDVWGGLDVLLKKEYSEGYDEKVGLDAACYCPENKKYCFFRGDWYARYTPGGGEVDAGYPLRISEHWHSSLCEALLPPYDAVFASKTHDNIIYFVKGSEYVRYKLGEGIDHSFDKKDPKDLSKLLLSYPQNAEYRWSGIWSLKPFSAITLGSFTPDGPTFSIRFLEDLDVTMESNEGLTMKVDTRTKNEKFPGYTKLFTIMGMGAGKTANIKLQCSDGTEIPAITVKNGFSEDDTDFSFAMGSCLDDARNFLNEIPIVEKIVEDQKNLDFMIWNGDTSYYTNGDSSTSKSKVLEYDMKSQQRMFLRMYKTRHHPSVAKVMQKIPAISTWDDHDFGFDNSDKGNMDEKGDSLNRDLITETQEVFRTCWPNNYFASNAIKTSFIYGNAEFFLPDCRSNRDSDRVYYDPDTDPDAGDSYYSTIIGSYQLNKLITAMQNSDADLKVLVLGSQLIPERDKSEGFYSKARGERTKLLNAFTDGSILGRVLVLSGDVHYSELSCYGGTSSEKPQVVEVTSSPMLLKSMANGVYPEPDSDDPNRIWVVDSGNGYVKISVSNDALPKIEIRMYNENGDVANIDNRSSDDGGAGGVATKGDWGSTAQAVWNEDATLGPLEE